MLAGDVNPLSPAIVAVVSPMPHMTKSHSVSETRGREEEGKEGGGGEDPLRGEIRNIITEKPEASHDLIEMLHVTHNHCFAMFFATP